jgi:peptide/nickel transport system substrate-binding protein
MRYRYDQLAAAGLLALAAAALPACGPGDAGPRGPDEPVGDHPTFSGGPPGGVLVALTEGEPDELNPLTFNSNPAYQAIRLMFRGLARRDSTLSNYVPDLARSWELQPDSTLVLQLRDDVRWHDGTPVTAEDVVFTIQRQMEPETASPRQADVAAVSRVAARDSFTVEVKLARTGPYTVNALLEVVPVPRHLLQDVSPADTRMAPFGRNPVGNGFFRFVRWQPGQQLVLEANPEMPEGRPALDRVVMRFVPDMNAAMTELLAGQGDLLRIPADQKERIEAAGNVELHAGPRVRPAWIAWNTQREPVNDPRVRRALLMAIDRDRLARGLFGDEGRPAYSPIPEALWESSPNVRPIPHDPAGARRLLEEVGWRDTDGDGFLDRNGQRLRVEVDYFPTEQWRQDVLVATQSMLREVGIELVPRAFERTAWVERLRAREFQGSLWGWGWGPGVVGPNAEMVFHSRSVPPNGPNFAGYSNPRVDQLIDAALETRDTTQLRQIWMEIEQHAIDDAVYAPLYLDPELFGVHGRFRNVRFRGIEWWEDVPYWYVQPNQLLPRDRSR